jgi:hypothetical protein
VSTQPNSIESRTANSLSSHSPTPKADDWTQADISLVEVTSGRALSGRHRGSEKLTRRFPPMVDGLPIPPATCLRLGLAPAVCSLCQRKAERRELWQPAMMDGPMCGMVADGRRVLVSETHRTVSRILDDSG